MSDLADWTLGREGLTYQACPKCQERWYFQRDFCPHCGAAEVETRASACIGTIYASTVVERAPSPEWRERAPYGLALIDLDESFRMMAHAELGVAIGDRVRIDFVRLGDRLLPIARPLRQP